ncbi:hypothetical protein Goari_002934 [Gossypium aridum]|uniref:Uncharacterized protein n=1 Tax=Gossypium aridum TaxID=34290 RepID=A0A7J8YAR4_GOSAI|nr:hypothetical protein [Gossypium aridum]
MFDFKQSGTYRVTRLTMEKMNQYPFLVHGCVLTAGLLPSEYAIDKGHTFVFKCQARLSWNIRAIGSGQ